MKFVHFFGVVVFFVLISFASAGNIAGVSPAGVSMNKVLRGGYAERYITIWMEADEPVKLAVTPAGEIASWLKFQENLTASKGKPARMLISINPPRDIPNGEYKGFLNILGEAINKEAREGHATGLVGASVVVTFSVGITDQEILGCKASEFSVGSVEKGDKITFTGKVLNEGNIRLKPKIHLDIWDNDQRSVQSHDFTGNETLPTREGMFSVQIPSDNLAIGQYWVDISVPDCFATQTLTFDVLEEGALKAEGILLGILSKIRVKVGETFQLNAPFRNVGEKAIDSQFKGQITREGEIVQLLESEITNVPISEETNFTFFFTPKKAGDYVVKGRAYYEKKKTFESSRIISAIAIGVNWGKRFMILVYIFFILLIAFLFYMIRKEKRRYLDKFRLLRS